MRIRAIAAMGLATVALVTVSACRVEQGAALFIGSERISENRVDEIVDGMPDKAREQMSQLTELTGGQKSNISTGGLRGFVVDALATIELGKLVAADTGREPDTSVTGAVEKFWSQPVYGLDEDNEFVQLAATAESYRTVLVEDAKPATVTDKELDAALDHFEFLAGEKYSKSDRDAIGQQLGAELESEAGRLLVGQQRQVGDYITDYDVTANPRYGQSFIVISLGRDNSPVFVAGIPS